MTKRAATVLAALTIAMILGPGARAQSTSVEDKLLELINGARSRPLVMHEGLRAAARSHAANMAAANRIDHSGARSRIYRSEPIPAERDGPPDNGFTATWCEVAGWEPANADENVAKTFFDAWQAKSEDSACMMSPAMTAAGVGMYQSGKKWWASLEVVQDRTRPRVAGAAVVPRTTVSPTKRPAASPRATSRESSSVGDLAASRDTRAAKPWFGWREAAVMVGAFMVVPILHTVRRRAARRRRHTIGSLSRGGSA